MADVVNASGAAAASAADAVSAAAQNASARVPATFEGQVLAYGSLFAMALFPIFIGAFRSVKHLKVQKVCRAAGAATEFALIFGRELHH